MSEAVRLFLIIFLSIIFGGAALTSLLLAVFFPLINRLLKTNLPGFTFGAKEGKANNEKEPPENNPVENPPAQSVSDEENAVEDDLKIIPLSVKSDEKTAEGEDRPQGAAPAQYSQTAPQKKPRPPDLHKGVPTVRIDTLFVGDGEDKKLTMTKIEEQGKLVTRKRTFDGLQDAPPETPSVAAKPPTVRIDSIISESKNPPAKKTRKP